MGRLAGGRGEQVAPRAGHTERAPLAIVFKNGSALRIQAGKDPVAQRCALCQTQDFVLLAKQYDGVFAFARQTDGFGTIE